MSTNLYQPMTAQTEAITRETRWLGRTLAKQGGSPIDPAFYMGKIMEVAAAAYGIVPPPNGRIYLVRGVKVNSMRPWGEAVRVGCPETSDQSTIWKVGDQYPASNKVIERDVILANFGRDITTFDDARAWGETNRLAIGDPHTTFAVAQKEPQLNKLLGMDPCWFISLKACSFDGYQRVVYVWWVGANREAHLRWATYALFGGGWVVFARE